MKWKKFRIKTKTEAGEKKKKFGEKLKDMFEN